MRQVYRDHALDLSGQRWELERYRRFEEEGRAGEPPLFVAVDPW